MSPDSTSRMASPRQRRGRCQRCHARRTVPFVMRIKHVGIELPAVGHSRSSPRADTFEQIRNSQRRVVLALTFCISQAMPFSRRQVSSARYNSVAD